MPEGCLGINSGGVGCGLPRGFFIDHCRLLIEGRENPRSGDVMDMIVCDSLYAGKDTSSDVPVWGS